MYTDAQATNKQCVRLYFNIFYIAYYIILYTLNPTHLALQASKSYLWYITVVQLSPEVFGQ